MTDLSADRYDRHREAGEILSTVLAEAADRVEPGVRLLDVAEFAEDRVRELGGEPAFPVNL
ncbi:MAG: M24 family metallopeptidase, partial [Halobacteriales archaeon]|nr:M24 family metallopeptidase [Halobacteriales archaeon]